MIEKNESTPYEQMFINFFKNINNKMNLNLSYALSDPINNLERIDSTLNKIYNNTLNEKNVLESNFEVKQVPFVEKALDFTERMYSKGSGIKPNKFDILDKNVINYLKDYNFELIQKMSNDTRLGVKGSIIEGIERGENVQQIANKIVNHVNEPFKVYKRSDLLNAEKGIIKLSDTKPIRIIKPYTRAMSIARTETARAYNNGMRNKFLMEGVQKVIVPHIPGECIVCYFIANGSPYNLSEINSPPWHPHCRHFFIPYKSTDKDLREFMTYEAVNNYQKSLISDIDYINFPKSQQKLIDNAFNRLPSNLKNDMFITEGVIEKIYGSGYRKIDNLYYQIGSEIGDDELIEIIITLYASNFYYRYSILPEMALITLGVFVAAFVNYYYGEPIPENLQTIFDTYIFGTNYK